MEKENKTSPHFESKCEVCVWYSGDHECPAFMGKIPSKIWKGTHSVVEDNQVMEITFEQKGTIL